MNHHDHAHHEHGKPAGPMAGPPPVRTEKDPVCGMDVPADSPLRSEFGGRTYVFCSRRCLERFERNPGRLPGESPASAEPARTVGAGERGMDLPDAPGDRARPPGQLPDLRHGARAARPSAPSRTTNPELVDMTRRFWVAPR